MKDAPYDIWRHITSFLPSEDVKGLLTVNYVLFNIAMDERYKSCMFGSLFHPRTLRTVRRVVDPQVASRVRVFNYMPGHLLKLLQESTPISRESAEVAKSRSRDLGEEPSSKPELKIQAKTLTDSTRDILPSQSPKENSYPRQRVNQNAEVSMQNKHRAVMPIKIKIPPISPDVALESLIKLIGRMTSLITLQVEIRGEEHYYVNNTKLPIFDIGWSSFGSSLVNLELRIPLEDMATVLPDPRKCSLKCLEALFLRAICASFTTEVEPILLETVIPFLNAHRQTLRSLTLDIAEQTDLSLLFLTLSLPFLTHLKLKVSLSQNDRHFTSLQVFFKAHRATLVHFEIEVMATFAQPFALQSFFSQDHFTVHLPRLKHLSIRMPLYNHSILPYIQRFQSTLISLHVYKTHQWSLADSRTLVEGFVSSGQLRKLDINVQEFSPELLTTLALNLPNLEVLTLQFDRTLPEGAIYSPYVRREIPQFCHILDDLFFPQWQLRTVNLSPLHVVHSLRASYKVALVKSLPNVASFSGLGRKQYISTTAFV